MIYLASPYSHGSTQVEYTRFLATREFVYKKIGEGIPLFSPIVYCHQFVKVFEAPRAAADWHSFNERMIRASSEMWVFMLDGWEESKGVAAEIALAEQLGLRTVYYNAGAFVRD